LSCAIGGSFRRIGRIYESGDLLAVDKPEGMACIPTRAAGSDSVLGRLKAELGEGLFVVHRLDTETSGVLVFARNAVMHRWLSMQFEGRGVRKEYLALVHGRLESDRGSIEAPLRVFGSGRVGVDQARGKPCVTEYEVLSAVGAFSLLSVKPLTGRQHQIRAHLYSTGHPVVGDRKYGERKLQETFPRTMLHALRIDLPMPDGSRLVLESPLPPSFASVLNGRGEGR
jgi:RluA family pseudouridine synthase